MIKSKALKMALAATLVLGLVMAPVSGANAETSVSAVSGSDASGNDVPDNSESGNGGTEEVKYRESEEEEEVIIEVPSTSSVKLGTSVVSTTIRGAYVSDKFTGTVIATQAEDLAAMYGLAADEQPYIRVYDIDVKNSPAAMASINAAAEAIGATVAGAANMEIGKVSAGKFTLLEQNGKEIKAIFGIPENAVKDGYAYAVICVRPGGVLEVLTDLDTNANTVTFNTTGGLGAYAIVMYPAA